MTNDVFVQILPLAQGGGMKLLECVLRVFVVVLVRTVFQQFIFISNARPFSKIVVFNFKAEFNIQLKER